jgi:hypothetical protein
MRCHLDLSGEADSPMHKDPPPSFFERPIRRLVIEGVIAGLIASIVVVGTWSLAASQSAQPPRERIPFTKDRN